MTTVDTKTFLSRLNWRHATKAFDPSKKIPADVFDKILESIRLAPTSFGLQPFDVYVVSDQATKDQIFAVGWGQVQYKTAEHIICFVGRSDVNARIDEFMNLMTGGNAAAREKLKGYEGMMKGSVGKFDAAKALDWANRQAYIALGFAMAACAELGVDSCPMEGFEPAKVDQILKLAPHQHSTVMLPVGYRDASVNVREKIRFPKESMFHTV